MFLAQIPAWVIGLLVALFLLISIGLILTVLIQRPMGGGLSGAFGSGAGSGQTAFGAKTGDVLTMFTIVVFAVWLLGAVGLNYATRPPAAPAGAQIAPAGGPPAEESAAGQAAGEGAGGEQAPPPTPDDTAADSPEATPEAPAEPAGEDAGGADPARDAGQGGGG